MASKPKPTKIIRDADIIDAAQELDLSENTVRRDIRRGAPHGRKGRNIVLNIPEYRAWRQEKGLSGERGRPPDHACSEDLEKARLRKENALASKYELQVARERDQLVDRAEYRGMWMQKVTAAKGKLLGLPSQEAPGLVGLEAVDIEARLRERIEQIIRELAEGN